MLTCTFATRQIVTSTYFNVTQLCTCGISQLDLLYMLRVHHNVLCILTPFSILSVVNVGNTVSVINFLSFINVFSAVDVFSAV